MREQSVFNRKSKDKIIGFWVEKKPDFSGHFSFNGADGRNRTDMGSPYAPQTYASTNFATSANLKAYKFYQTFAIIASFL